MSAILSGAHAEPGTDGPPRFAFGAGPAAHHDLAARLEDGAIGLTLHVTGRAPAFDGPATELVLVHTMAALRQFTRTPATTLADLDLLTVRERTRVLEEFNATTRDYPRDSAIHEVFAGQVAARPDAAAVVCGQRSLTYRQLDDRAAAMTAELRAAGVRRGDRVAVSFGKEPDLVVAILAVLRAGAAYVPVPPGCPRSGGTSSSGTPGPSRW